MPDQQDFRQWRQWASRFGSPLYVYQLDEMTRRIDELRQALPEQASLFYSLKANPLPSLVERAVQSGCALEITSENELAVACSSGVSRQRILYGGPGKTAAEIHQALEAGVTYFSAESWTDLERLSMEAEQTGCAMRVILRINPRVALAGGLAMSGGATQFGFEEQELILHWSRSTQLSPLLKILGFHVYYGTQMKGVEGIAEAADQALQSIERICQACDLQPEVVNLGGGFPWAFGREQTRGELCGLKEALEKVLKRRVHSAGATLWFESGRYLAASSGTLVSTILDIKVSGDSRFVITDAGINHLGGMSGLGRIPRSTMSFIPSTGPSEEAFSSRAQVVGPLCSPLDCLSRNATLPDRMQPGDMLAIPNVGAYGLTASLVAFLTRPPPAEVALDGDRLVAVQRLQSGHRDELPTTPVSKKVRFKETQQ